MAKEKKGPTTLTPVDADGKSVKSFAVANERLLALAPATTKVCLQLRNGSGVDWKIELTVSLDVYPYPIVGGKISGTICDSPNWKVTGGSLGGGLQINGQHTGSGSCAGSVIIVGNFQNPSSYRGTYGFNGSSSSFKHTTLFLNWGPC